MIAALTAALALAHPPPDDDAPALARDVLGNGLQVWCEERPGARSVAAALVVRAGARFEDAETSGLSHFLEHMVFAGTERWDEDTVKRVIEARGGRWNGFTGAERTLYYAHVAAEDLPLALTWLDQVVFHPTLPAEKVDKERAVVFRERKGRRGPLLNWLDARGFGYRSALAMRQALFPDSSLGLPTLGEDASLDAATREGMAAYYADHYAPANATLIVVGGAGMAATLPLAEATFGGAPAGSRAPAPATPAEAAGAGREAFVRGPMDIDEATARVGVRIGGRAHPDRWALEVLAEALNVSLMEAIRYDAGLVYQLSFAPTLYDDVGYLSFFSRSGRADTEEILAIVQAQLDAARAGGLSEEQVARAKASLIGRRALAMEDNALRAQALAAWSSLLGPDEASPDYGASIAAVTSADVRRVAAAWLPPERRVVGGHAPIFVVATDGRWAGLALLAGLAALLARWRRARRRYSGSPTTSKT